MASSNVIYSGAASMPPSSPSKADARGDEFRCVICQQTNCDIQIISCGCFLHTTCLPLNILFVKQPIKTNYANQQTFCPCCHRSTILQIRVLPLPMAVIEEAARLRDKDNEILSIHNSEASSLACSPANSIALFNGTNKRPFAAKSSISRSFRTGRWSSDESAFTDKLIKAFDAGLLPLPHGIKLNDFLCDLLSCRTSRLTKKLKNAKLSARTYRSWASGNTMAASSTNYVGGQIQRSLFCFLKTITPEWVRMELQFNISRMWRTHLANFCLQISYLQLDTKEWFASLDAVDYTAMSCNETKFQARRKRMRSALTEDANAAARTQPLVEDTSSNNNEAMFQAGRTSSEKEGVFVGGLPFKRLSDMNLKSLANEEEKSGSLQINTNVSKEDEVSQHRGRVDILNGSIPKESSAKMTSLRKFSFDSSILEQSMKHSTSMSSFVDLFTPDLRPTKPPSRASSIDLDAPSIDVAENRNNEQFEISTLNQGPDSEVDTLINEAIDSVLESSTTETDYQGLFLKEISQFLTEADSPFQHVDLWVPMDVSHSDIVSKTHIGGSSNMETTSSNEVTGIIYGGQQSSSVRLSNAGYITTRASPQIMNQLNEFGMYSKHFSFSAGFGMPGRVYLSKTPSWENNLSLLKPEQFARVGGAKIYGVNTALCIPVFTPIGTMIISLYSTQNLSRNVQWEKTCMEYFWKLRPEPKWKLTIDVGLRTSPADAQEISVSQAPTSSPRMAPAKTQAFVIPPSPTARKSPQEVQSHSSLAPNMASDMSLKDNKPSVAPHVTPYTWNEQSLALLIGKFMPLDRDSSANQLPSNPVAGNSDFASNLMSLRLLLLRPSFCRTSAESKIVEIIIGKYQSYLGANKKEHDIILSTMNDWIRLSMLSSSISEAQSKPSFYDARPAVIRHNSYSSNHSVPSLNLSTSSPMMSPSSFIPSVGCAGAHASAHNRMIPSINQFGDNFSLPHAAFGNGHKADGSMAGKNGSMHQISQQINVPRVVSEQGPIEKDPNEEDRYKL